MFLLTLLQQNGVEITPQIQALISKFGNRCIPKQFQKDFVKRVESLLVNNLFGVYDFDACDNSTNLWECCSNSYNRYEYATLKFAEKFPKFDRLFVEIWILMNPGKLSLYYDQEDRFNHYYYRHFNGKVMITINSNFVKIELQNIADDSDINIFEITIY